MTYYDTIDREDIPLTFDEMNRFPAHVYAESYRLFGYDFPVSGDTSFRESHDPVV